MRRGQSAFEYIMLVGIIMLVVVSGVGIIYQYSQKSNDELKIATIDKVGIDIIDAVERLYYIGGDSWETLKIQIPQDVNNITVKTGSTWSEIVISYTSIAGMSEAVFFTDINIRTPYSGNISNFFHPGLNNIRVTSKGTYVEIQEVS